MTVNPTGEACNQNNFDLNEKVQRVSISVHTTIALPGIYYTVSNVLYKLYILSFFFFIAHAKSWWIAASPNLVQHFLLWTNPIIRLIAESTQLWWGPADGPECIMETRILPSSEWLTPVNIRSFYESASRSWLTIVCKSVTKVHSCFTTYYNSVYSTVYSVYSTVYWVA